MAEVTTDLDRRDGHEPDARILDLTTDELREQPLRWYQKPWVWASGGVSIGTIAVALGVAGGAAAALGAFLVLRGDGLSTSGSVGNHVAARRPAPGVPFTFTW